MTVIEYMREVFTLTEREAFCYAWFDNRCIQTIESFLYTRHKIYNNVHELEVVVKEKTTPQFVIGFGSNTPPDVCISIVATLNNNLQIYKLITI